MRATSSRSRGDIGVPSEATMPRPRSADASTAAACPASANAVDGVRDDRLRKRGEQRPGRERRPGVPAQGSAHGDAGLEPQDGIRVHP